MLKKRWLPSLMALMVIGCFSISFSAQEKPYVELGKITVPRDMEVGMKILPKGEYQLTVFKGTRPSIILADVKPDAAGITMSWGNEAEVTEAKSIYPQPKVDVDVVTEGGESFVQIRVLLENKEYKSLWKCAEEPIDPSKRAKEQGPIDPAIETELKLLRETHVLLDRLAEKIWPGWDSYKTLEFILRFPNRDVVAVTLNERLPRRFKVLPVGTIEEKTVYIDRTKELPGRINPFMSIHGHGDITGVTALLMSPLETGAVNPKVNHAPELRPKEGQIEDSNIMRMLLYVHEAFHSQQAIFMLEAQKAGLMKLPAAMNSEFDATLEYSVYADIEGEALLRAYREKNRARALEDLKDSLVARELKHKAMPPGAVAEDVWTTQAEGTADYSSLDMAILAKKAGYEREAEQNDRAINGAFKHLDEYIKKEGTSTLEEVSGRTLEVSQRAYAYGPFQCFLLDRFLPTWKKGFFEKGQDLDEVITGFLKLSNEDQQKIARRLKTDFPFDEIWAKHSRDIKDRDEAIQLVLNRKGRKYVIDLKHAQIGFEINPRGQAHVVMYKGDELFPHGLVKFRYGSLNLTSQDTPIRNALYQNFLEWVDTEAKAGEKGYELKYAEKVGDLFKDVTLATRGFTMTAKAIKIVEEPDTIRISIID